MKITLSELRTLIRESVAKILKEDDIASWDAQTFWDKTAPTEKEKNSMTNALRGTVPNRWELIKNYYKGLDSISELENQISLKKELEPPQTLNPKIKEMWKKLQIDIIEDLEKQKAKKQEELAEKQKKLEEFFVFLGQLGVDRDSLEIVLSNEKERENLGHFLENQRKKQIKEKMASMNESKRTKK